ncbi:DUF4012 domain-containing protein [Bifidobacterium scardovii]|uniref:Methyl-accepting chemotaxis protein n=1 Tax=Bifidobacterium scardovii TaxID=158787 RepID=A0A087DJC9_9BIFI|nr:DUF4012 domain-containing protein [Bifidobacterium scardovii]KFI95629.1 methyl-accepting chemotaxis protein [Bifidobacterium scardovii]BAQ32475.1 conserved hypothetical protein [Bifidobacterium scardovii JCM 12489 = DSM 13734]
MRPIAPKHITHTGHGNLSEAVTPKRVALFVLSLLAGAALSVVGIYGISALVMLSNVSRLVDASENLANTALGCGGDKDISSAAKELVSSTRGLRDELNRPQWTFFRDHTAYGADIDAARAMLDSVGNLVDGPFTDAANLAGSLSGFSMQDKTVDLSALTAMPKIVKQARADIKTETAKLNTLQQPTLGVTSKLLNAGKSGLASVDTLLDEYDELVNLIPQLLGENGARTYLAVIYNPAELRSGGGMVGNIAAITADHGKVTIGDFTATTNLKYADQPFDDENVQEAEVFGEWIWKYPQTTTMNPNFRRAAITLANLWKSQEGHENADVSGVLALDPVFLQSLIGATGSVKLSDGKVLDGTNTVKFFLDELYSQHPDFEEQNAYTNNASKEIMTSVFSGMDGSSLSGVLKAIRDSSADSHFKLWMQQDEELAALVQTRILDANVAGLLPGDEATPVSGVYLNEMTASKLDWYLDMKVKITKTCGDTFAGNQTYLDDSLQAPAMSTVLGGIAEQDLGDEYTVVVTLHNTMTKQQAKELPTFVTGSSGSGSMWLTTILMAPAGGEITSIAYDNASYDTNGIVADHQFVVLNSADGLAPESTTTIAYTVRASEKATSNLSVATTPIISQTGTYTGTGEVIDECGGNVPDAAEDALIGTGSAGETGSDGIDGTGTDGNGTDGNGTDGNGSTDANAGAQGSTSEDKNSTNTSGSGGSGGALDSLDKLKGQIECPVDFKKLASL